jgi:hypothetical protein
MDLNELTAKDTKSWTCEAYQFIELIPDAVCLLDDEGLICHANSAFFANISPIGRLKNKDFLRSIIHSDDRDAFCNIIEQAILQQNDSTFLSTYDKCKTLIYKGRSTNASEKSQYFHWTIGSGFGFIVLTGRYLSIIQFAELKLPSNLNCTIFFI